METAARIAAELTLAINQAFVGRFTADRKYVPKYRLEDLSDLRVSVAPLTKTTVRADRGSVFTDATIQILFHKQTDPESLSDNDELMELVQDVDDWLRGNILTGYPDAKWISSANGDETSPMFSLREMEEQKVFVGVLTVTYRVRR